MLERLEEPLVARDGSTGVFLSSPLYIAKRVRLEKTSSVGLEADREVEHRAQPPKLGVERSLPHTLLSSSEFVVVEQLAGGPKVYVSVDVCLPDVIDHLLGSPGPEEDLSAALRRGSTVESKERLFVVGVGPKDFAQFHGPGPTQ